MLGDGKGLRGERHREAGDSGRCGEVRRSLHLLRGSARGQGRQLARPPRRDAAIRSRRTGRCVTLLKVLMTNVCVYDCCYCVNRASNAEAPDRIYAPRVGRPHHRLLPSQLYRGAVPLLGRRRMPDRTTELMIAARASCGRSTAFAATSTPRPSPAPRWSSSTSWGACPTASR